MTLELNDRHLYPFCVYTGAFVARGVWDRVRGRGRHGERGRADRHRGYNAARALVTP